MSNKHHENRNITSKSQYFCVKLATVIRIEKKNYYNYYKIIYKNDFIEVIVQSFFKQKKVVKINAQNSNKRNNPGL